MEGEKKERKEEREGGVRSREGREGREGRGGTQTTSGSLYSQFRYLLKRTAIQGKSKAVSREIDFFVLTN